MYCFLSSSAIAHSWYPPECCSGLDCKPVAGEKLVENAKGIIYEGVQFTPNMIKPTQDKDCHVCIGNYPLFKQGLGQPIPRCVYIRISS